MDRIVIRGFLIGIFATAFMDLWAAVVKHGLKLPTAHWDLVGRWFGHMPKGKFVHQSIADASPIANELVVGWIGHYVTGVIYGLAYVFIVTVLFSAEPTFMSALAFGLATLFAPWLIMQPALGAGVFASRTPRPGVTRLVNLSMHTVFGISLYAGWRLTT